ncbi:hypothetical protein F4009_08060 [Candidatus Poribacteria bacterium]|nr:hypothetical protein [Candidatus Poribacteria bacterium]MYH82713.1 hypothetical protein [Candidatus Poribacteria bacterium]MYK93937.1 hypothetical protein [Candidatus Poribacteria bacterium]
MALFGRKDGRPLFGKRKETEPKKPERHELVDIPIDSMIELSDLITYEETGDTSHAFKLVIRKKYEGDSLRRYMYHIRDADEEVVIGVDHVAGTQDAYEISRWIVDDECELADPLPEFMTLYFPDPDNEDEDIAVEYSRQDIVLATLTVTDAEGEEKFDVELHEYASDDDAFMSIELCGDWLTFYTGVLITRSDIEIYPAMAPQSGNR